MKKAIDTVTLKTQIFGEGEPLLAIHGVVGSGDNLRVLNKLPFKVHLPDLRNHGDSPHHRRCFSIGDERRLVTLLR